MSEVIIYNQESGIPAVVIPSQQGLDLLGIHEVAKKSVPFGRPFKIIDLADLPSEPQESWVVSDDDLTDGFGEAPE